MTDERLLQDVHAVGSLVTQLGGALQQLQQSAQGGTNSPVRCRYGEILSLLRKSAGEGKADAADLLDHLGEGRQ